MNYTTTTTFDAEPVYEDMNAHQGWICPKCGRAVAPDQKTCPYCSTIAADEGLAPGEQIICDAM